MNPRGVCSDSMRATILTVGILSVATWVRGAQADIAPSPEGGNRFIDRWLVFDTREVGQGISVSYAESYWKSRGKQVDVPDPTVPEPLRPDTIEFSVYFAGKLGDGRAWEDGVALAIPPQQEAVIGVDPRVKGERHYRLRAVRGEPVSAEALEDVFYDEAGAVVCRRPPMSEDDIDLDPCDPTSAWRRRAHFAMIGGLVSAPFLGVAGLVVWRRRRKSQR